MKKALSIHNWETLFLDWIRNFLQLIGSSSQPSKHDDNAGTNDVQASQENNPNNFEGNAQTDQANMEIFYLTIRSL